MVHRLSIDSHGAGCPFLTVIPSIIRLQIREQIVDVPVLWFLEDIVEVVAGEVVCNLQATARVDAHIFAVVTTRLSRS